MPSLCEVVDGTARLNLHPGQTRAWESQARIVAVVAGTQSGKTSFGPWWLNREIDRRGSGDYIAATSSYDLFKLKMLPEMREVFEHTLRIGRYWAGDGVLELRDPSTGKFLASRADDKMWGRIILRSAASKSGLESASAKGAWLDEAGQDEFTLDAFDAVLRRLSLARGRILITTTPYNLGWLKQRIMDRANGKDIDLIQFASIANPSFPIEEFEEREATMPEWKFKMFYKGQLGRPPGMIYNDFVDEYREQGGHKVRPFQIDPHWPRFVGVDPGAVHTAKIWLAHDVRADEFYLYRESLEGGKPTKEHAREAKDLAARNGERVVTWHVGQKSEEQQRLDWIDAGVPNVKEPPIHDVEGGIDKVIQLLREHRLFIFDTCTGVLDEIGRYSRVLDEMNEPTDKIKDKDTFHRLDALRYVAVGVVKPRRKSVTIGRAVGLYTSHSQPPPGRRKRR